MLNSKILIVEDEIIVAEYLKQRLEDLGYNIVGITAKRRCNNNNWRNNSRSYYNGHNTKRRIRWNKHSPNYT